MTGIRNNFCAGGRRKTLVLILGMHRSGTSTLAGSLQQMGLYLGDVSEKNPHNPKGNRENSDIMELNETLLRYNGGSWFDPPATINWDASHIVRRDLILEALFATDACSVGFKDPRSLVTLPFWTEAYENTKFAGIFRHPLRVADSLLKRNKKIAINHAFDLYVKYNTLLAGYQRRYNFPLICFDCDKATFISRTRGIAGELGLNPACGENAELFYDEKLISGGTVPDEQAVPDEALNIYRTLFKIYERQ